MFLRLKDGKPIKSKTMVYENHVAKYTITEIKESSEATYTCRASNTAGTAETSCKLTVQGIYCYLLDFYGYYLFFIILYLSLSLEKEIIDSNGPETI